MNSKITRFIGWLLGSLCAIAAVSCTAEKKAPAPDLVAVHYVQTQCSDRWGQAASSQQLVAAAQTYLTQHSLTLYQPQVSGTYGIPACASCPCPTGLVLDGAVQSADLAAVLALGFTKR